MKDTQGARSAVECRAVAPHNDADFAAFEALAAADGFTLKYDKKEVRVWGRSMKNDPLKMVKIRTTLQFPVSVVFDVLCDDTYRPEWDESAIESRSLFALAKNSTLDYYSMKMPAPLSKRDLVTVRTWRLQAGGRIAMVNSSVVLKGQGPRKGHTRAHSRMSGYILEPTPDGRCSFTYISHIDPCGGIPKMVINYIGTKMAPKSVATLITACSKYSAWKKGSAQPELKPWINPDQNNLPFYASEGGGGGACVAKAKTGAGNRLGLANLSNASTHMSPSKRAAGSTLLSPKPKIANARRYSIEYRV